MLLNAVISRASIYECFFTSFDSTILKYVSNFAQWSPVSEKLLLGRSPFCRRDITYLCLTFIELSQSSWFKAK